MQTFLLVMIDRALVQYIWNSQSQKIQTSSLRYKALNLTKCEREESLQGAAEQILNKHQKPARMNSFVLVD